MANGNGTNTSFTRIQIMLAGGSYLALIGESLIEFAQETGPWTQTRWIIFGAKILIKTNAWLVAWLTFSPKNVPLGYPPGK